MKTVSFSELDETMIEERLPNGLDVCILPKTFNKTYATLTAKYGSIDNRFLPPGAREWLQAPDGIAHFLEHKMFEMPDGSDVFQQFGRQGAQANAFTSFNRTAYLFAATSEFEKNLETLLDFVQTPAWTDQSVEKEKGIIGQEIRMYADNPDWRIYHGLIANMYQNHPIKIDIAGTAESIAQITKDLLFECYDTFYHPSNLLLFVTGPVDPKAILELVARNQAKKGFRKKAAARRRYPDEPKEAAKKSTVTHMDVSMPKCLIGYKEKKPFRQGEELMRHELSVSLVLELLFGRGTENYHTLIGEQLIDDSFGFDYTEEASFGFSIIGGNTPDPERLIGRMKEMVAGFKRVPLDKAAFDRARKKQIGGILRAFNSLEFIANQFTRYRFNQMDLFRLIPALEALALGDLKTALEEHFDETCFSSYTVLKK
ncbi:insulinase family protein [Sporolactobacillus sp. THM7-7]|nr:insulinase family protein [Sporolactobacillus sp. THM7-7]